MWLEILKNDRKIVRSGFPDDCRYIGRGFFKFVNLRFNTVADLCHIYDLNNSPCCIIPIQQGVINLCLIS